MIPSRDSRIPEKWGEALRELYREIVEIAVGMGNREGDGHVAVVGCDILKHSFCG